jgi:ArsR family transcriptional regulator
MTSCISGEIQPYKAQAQFLKVLTHPVRLAILNILRDGEQCVCHMKAHLGYRQAYISQQLQVLRGAGLIQDRRDGWNIFYRVAEPRIFDLLSAAAQVSSAVRAGEVEPLEMIASCVTVPCACPKCSAVGKK